MLKNNSYKCLNISLNAISNFTQPRVFKISKPKGHPISNCEVRLYKKEGKQAFDFNLKLEKSIPSVDFKFDNLGFNEEIVLTSSEFNCYSDKEGITSIKLAFKDFQTIQGELSELTTKRKKDIENTFLRIVIPTEKEAPTTLLDGTSYTDNKTEYGHGLATLNLNDKKYQLFRYKQKDSEQYYLVIDCLSLNDFETFYYDSSYILRAFSLITGNWYGGQRFILTSKDPLFEQIDFVHFKKDDNTLITNYRIIDSFKFVQYMKALGNESYKISENRFPGDILSQMAQKMQKEEELKRALFLVLEGNDAKSPILKTCTYLVAIETLASLISKNHKEHFITIKNLSVAKELKKKIKAVVEVFKNDLEEKDYNAVVKKTEYLNSPANMDKILKSFDLYDIQLSQSMQKLIKSRNVYLHGKTPYKENQIRDKMYEIGINSLKLQMLTCILFLKYCGYSGHIKNLAGYQIHNDYDNDEASTYDEHLYHII